MGNVPVSLNNEHGLLKKAIEVSASSVRAKKHRVVHVSDLPEVQEMEDILGLLSLEWSSVYRKIASRADFDVLRGELKTGISKPIAVFVTWSGWHHFYKSFTGSDALAENVFLLDDSLRAYYASNANISFEKLRNRETINGLKFDSPICWRC